MTIDSNAIDTHPNQLARRMYTVAEAAAVLGIGRSTAYELILRGELQATHIGRRRLISPAVLDELLGSNTPDHGAGRPL